MVIIGDIIKQLIDTQSEFERIYKCLNKKQQLQKTTVEEHISNIISEYNKIKSIYFAYNQLLNNENQLILLTVLRKSHERLLKIFDKYKLHIQIPNIQTIETEEHTHMSDSKSKDNFKEMAITVIDVINIATKVVPEYDGSPSNLHRFIGAIKVIQDNVGEFEKTAVEIVKTKLKDNVRNYISNEATLQAIIDKLSTSIKPESTDLIISKLKNLKQSNRSANDYVKEIEKLSDSLKTAYLSEGITMTIAEKYTTKNVVQTMKDNTTDENIKVIFDAAKFENVSEVSEKFLTVKSENNQNNAQINYFQRKPFNRFRGNQQFQNGFYRGNNRNFQGNFKYNFQRNFDQNANNSNNQGNSRGFYRGNQNKFRGGYRHVNHVNAETENSNDPQSLPDLQLREM